MATVTVNQLLRYPVKSLGGTEVDEVRVDRRGVHADRLWALRDLDNNITASARRIPALLNCSARYAEEPGPAAGPGNVPAVIITFPDGTERSSGDADIHDRLSEVAGRAVRLTALLPEANTSLHRLSLKQLQDTYSADIVREDFGLSAADALPDTSVFTPKQVLTLARFATPPGTFVDLSPVHVLSVNSLSALSPDGPAYDVRRFRPNILVEVAGTAEDFPEMAWVGAEVTLGTTTLRIGVPTIRCVVPTRPQPGLELDRGLGRVLAQRTDRFMGVYADVAKGGVVRVGDIVEVRPARDPGIVRRTADTAVKGTMRQLQRLLEATVLRGN